MKGLLQKWLAIAIFTLFLNSISHGQVSANFISNIVKGCSPITINFQDNSSGNIIKWNWDFGNGNKSQVQNPSAIYISPGLYTVSLIIESNSGIKDTIVKSNYIEVFKNPVASFIAVKTIGCVGESIQFEDKSVKGTGNIVNYVWDFGNGNLSSLTNPSTVFDKERKYDITLIVKDDNGCESSHKVNEHITINPLPNPDFTADNTSGCDSPFTVNFTNKSNNQSAQYLWSFGDGNTSTNNNPTHIFHQKKNYDVRLTMTDNKGCVNSILKSNYIALNSIKADFGFGKTEFCANEPMLFQNLTVPDNNSIRYYWDFGNNRSSTTRNPSNLYSASDEYNVKLISYIPGTTCKDSIQKIVKLTIFPIPDIQPVISDTHLCYVPHRVDFSPSEPVKSAFWRFTSKTTDVSNSPNTSFMFMNAGNYDIYYKFVDFNGCVIENTLVKKIEAEDPELFISGDSSGCIPTTRSFIPLILDSKYPLRKFKWFLDGILVSTDSIFKYEFTKAGNGNMQLEVENKFGCVYKKNETYSFGEKTNPEFGYLDTIICYKDTVRFINLTDTSEVKVTKLIWQFNKEPDDSMDIYPGKEITEDDRWDLKKAFETSLKYHDVSLITYNYGCADTVKKEEIIKVDGPKAGITIETTPCSNFIKLKNSSEEFTRFKWDITNNRNFHLHDSISMEILLNLDTIGSISVDMWVANDTNRCEDDSINQEREIKRMIRANFNHSKVGCAPITINCYNNSSVGTAQIEDKFFWYIDGKQVKPESESKGLNFSSRSMIDYNIGHMYNFNPVFNFHNSGLYKVKLVSVDQDGCKDSFTRDVFIPGPDIDISVKQKGTCLPVEVELIVLSYKSGQQGLWDMGNGDVIAANSPFAKYTYINAPKDGILPIKYELSDSNGCKTWEEFNIIINGPNIELVSKDAFTCDKSEVEFFAYISNKTDGFTYTCDWKLGDGSSSDKEHFKHQYTSDGSYEVVLIVTDNFGCYALSGKTIHFSPGELNAKIYSDTIGSICPPLVVSFYSESDNKQGVPIVSYYWDFGDNTYSTQANPRKTYTIPGKYTVTLSITDKLGCKDIQIIPELIVVDGPIGEYSFSPDKGCEPLTVSFKAKSEDPSNSYTWDLGDGYLSGNQNHFHTYTYVSTFTPLLILSDTNGCSYTLPPIGDINVYPLPQADFEATGFCLNSPSVFESYSSVQSGFISTTKWYFNDDSASIPNPTYSFKSAGTKNVTFIAQTDKGCITTVEKPIKIYGFEPSVVPGSNKVCLGEQIKLRNTSKSDTQIVYLRWEISDNQIKEGEFVVVNPDAKGWYSANLYLRDALGCDTSMYFENVVLVGDTIAAIPNDMLHVSVIDNTSMQIKYTKSQEVDFETYMIYNLEDEGKYKLINEISNIEDTITSKGGINTLHNVYCFTVVQKNICGYVADPEEGKLHCSVELSGQPDTNVSKLYWNPYHGWEEVDKYVIYRERVNTPGSFDSIGMVSGNTFTYHDSAIVCYTDHFYKVRAYEKQGYQELSWSDTCRVRPIYFNIVPPPHILVASVPDNENIEVEWVSISESRAPLSQYVVERSINGNKYVVNDIVPAEEAVYYFDNKKLDVQSHNYYYRVKVLDECKDESDYSDIAKTVLLKSYFNDDYKPVLYWTKYQKWEEGVSHYIIEQKMPDGKFVAVGQSSGPDDTVFVHQNVNSNCTPEYVYRVIAIRNNAQAGSRFQYNFMQSISNHTVVPVISKLFAPTAFTPNGDGLNDEFETKGIYIKEFNLKIFNRWGEKLFESDDCFATWDGTFKGELVTNDVYLYIVEAIGADGVRHVIKNDLTVLR
jgi:gliding motility-associated-like protein